MPAGRGGAPGRPAVRRRLLAMGQSGGPIESGHRAARLAGAPRARARWAWQLVRRSAWRLAVTLELYPCEATGSWPSQVGSAARVGWLGPTLGPGPRRAMQRAKGQVSTGAATLSSCAVRLWTAAGAFACSACSDPPSTRPRLALLVRLPYLRWACAHDGLPPGVRGPERGPHGSPDPFGFHHVSGQTAAAHQAAGDTRHAYMWILLAIVVHAAVGAHRWWIVTRPVPRPAARFVLAARG